MFTWYYQSLKIKEVARLFPQHAMLCSPNLFCHLMQGRPKGLGLVCIIFNGCVLTAHTSSSYLLSVGSPITDLLWPHHVTVFVQGCCGCVLMAEFTLMWNVLLFSS